uniref:Transmembrane domain-containing protein n=2 Tax=Strongyloides papillosus TaxID=174720 RepID=A0A0N5BR29_STREA
MANETFSDKEKDQFIKELESVKKIIPDSVTIQSIQESIKTGTAFPFQEIPKLHTDKEAILYVNLLQPNCPKSNSTFKLKNYLDIFIETSSIEAQNALRRENVEFKGFWSAMTCFLITLNNHQTTMLIPIMIYEYGYNFLKWLIITYIFLCIPAMVFSITLSQYSGLDSSRVYSRIKKVWRGMEYVILIRTLYSILLIHQEIQFFTGTFQMLDSVEQSNKNYLESCLSKEGGCTNIGFIHPCFTGYSEDEPNNEHCRELNQVNYEKYIESKPTIKIISTIQHLYSMFKVPIYKRDIKFSFIMPISIIFLLTFFLYIGKAKCVAIVALLSLPVVAGQLYGIFLLSANDWKTEFQQFVNIEFVPSFYMAMVVVNIAIRSFNIIDMVPKISASLPPQIKAIYISFLTVICNIIVIIISTSLYFGSTIYYKNILMKRGHGYGRIPTFELTNILPYLTLNELLIINNKQFLNYTITFCTIIQRCFILSIYIEIFYDYTKTISMRIYTLFSNYDFFSKFVTSFLIYSIGLFLLEGSNYSIFYHPQMLKIPKMDPNLLFYQFFIIAYVYGINRYLGHLREMNGNEQLRDKILKALKYYTPIIFGIAIVTQKDKDKSNYYSQRYFNHNAIIIALEESPLYLFLTPLAIIVFFIVIDVVKSTIDGVSWKTVFRSMDYWSKRENKFIKVSTLHSD